MSEVKVNKISPRSGTEVTLGDSGDTFTIPSGATINNQGTATNFGATGSASWNTTVKTGDFTAVAGEGYFVNTTSGEIDVTLPAGSPGAVVAVKDYAKTWDTNNCVIISNSSEKIGGSTNNAILSTEGLAVTLIYIDSTQGWLVTDDGLQSSASTNPFMEATGGTITTSGNCKIHTFTGPGTFTVCKTATSAANNEVSYMVVAGGGAGSTKNLPAGPGSYAGGGGGAGGFREDKSPVTPYTASPLDGAGPISVTATGFPITVGAGGAATAYPVVSPFPRGGDGVASTFSTITSAGGGGGGSGFANCSPSNRPGANGGSGGGSGGINGYVGGTGNTPPTSPAQGTNGGPGTSNANTAAGGGGGATVAGTAGGSSSAGGAGGAGATTSITASPVAYGGGGGGASGYPGGAGSSAGVGGTGGGGTSNFNSNVATGSGTVNTGGGGAGAGSQYDNATAGTGGTGGSGIVVIRYKFQ